MDTANHICICICIRFHTCIPVKNAFAYLWTEWLTHLGIAKAFYNEFCSKLIAPPQQQNVSDVDSQSMKD